MQMYTFELLVYGLIDQLPPLDPTEYSRQYRKNASSAERDIVDYILSDPEAAVGQSIHKLAAQTYTSASTVVRLCKKLGCGGYKEFQQALIYELAVSNKSNDIAVGGVIAGDTTDVIIEKVTAKNISSLELTRQLLDAQVVDSVVSLMMQAHSICLSCNQKRSSHAKEKERKERKKKKERERKKERKERKENF